MTSEKSDFITVWEILGPLYNEFREKLRRKGLAYEGMIMRDHINRIDNGDNECHNEFRQYHFVGFNALNGCEKKLFLHLKKRNKASFYWDYDPSYVNDDNNEAGFFIRENIKTFGQDIEPAQSNPDTAITVYSSPSEIAQTKIIPEMEKKCSLFTPPRGYSLEKALISSYGADNALRDAKYFNYFITLDDIFMGDQK